MYLTKTLKLTFVFALILTLFTSLAFREPVKAASTQVATVNTNTLNVRSGAGTKYRSVGTLKKGTKLTVYAKTTSGWSEIHFKSKKAYVSSKYLKFSSPPSKVTVSQYKYKSINQLRYPQVKGLSTKTAENKINQTLLNHVAGSYKAYLQMLKDEKEWQSDASCKESPSMCDYDYRTSFSTQYNNGKVLSILIYDYGYYGGAHGTGYVTSYNFNVTTGQRILIGNLLNTSTKISKVQRYAFSVMKNREPFYVTRQSEVPVNKNSQFIFVDGGIHLVFQEYEVAPYAAGYPHVKIPASVYK